MEVVFAKQDRSEADLCIQKAGLDCAFKGLLRTQVLELLSCSDTEGRQYWETPVLLSNSPTGPARYKRKTLPTISSNL